MLTSAAEDLQGDIDLTSSSLVLNVAEDEIIGQKYLEDIRERLLQHKYLTNPPQTPLDKILANVSNIETENEQLEVLSLPDPFDLVISRPK